MTPPMRCLIVDDSAAFRDAARSMLERAGIDVVGMASSGAEALEVFGALHPDVTLVDVDLGADSGFDVVRQLHDANSPAPSLILISTHSEQDFVDLIAESPALGFLPKFALSPAAIRELLER
jgi:DNA-binding NarL/FixJ family response regulator